ncbi:unnamed protein product [Spirodela intermedia]|uniref:Kinesin motor domain-containing protein n=1 Tax=Spirodela intermedia TaxID=51605 RepID=A0A7I8KDA0_SPIIN|nr:unnamed protein product [Spirodela intermedia]
MSPGALGTLSSPTRSLSPLLPTSDLLSPRTMSPVRRSSRSGQENAPPPDPNIQIDRSASPVVLKKSPTRLRNMEKVVSDVNSVEDGTPDGSDSSVKVVVRIRPAHAHDKGGEKVTKKVSSDSLVVGGRSFSFHSVMGPESTQEDVFRLVGLPLVKNSMAGFNTSILSYGETGSGKTYTMWGPLSAMLEESSIDTCQGIAPRIFHMLFQEIQKNQESAVDKQLSFQTRCSFLEINDLLDTSQRNLQIRDDTKNGFYVENLTEEYVTTVQDVTQIIVKGLSSRRVGATSVNSKSSRSHIVLTCVIESWCQGTSTKSLSSSKISRISLVDLAGSDRNKLNEADRQNTKEGRKVHKSLSSLGKLVNILAEASHSGKCQDIQIPYTDSCLTNLMRESLGGNAKTAFICTVSPDASCENGTLRTLRFAQQAKCIQNKPAVNEITEDYVNDLSDQIRHLKEELIREKSYQDTPVGATGGYLRVEKARQSLNLLRASLNRSLALPPMDNDSEEEVEINEDDVSQLCEQLGDLHSVLEENPIIVQDHDGDVKGASLEDHSGNDEGNARGSIADGSLNLQCGVVSCFEESNLDEPVSSESPKVSSSLKKGFASSPNLSESKTKGPAVPSNNSEDKSIKKKMELVRSSLQSKKLSPTDSLAASLHRGLQAIDYHQRNSASEKTPLTFSFDHLIAKSSESSDLTDKSVPQSTSEGPLTSKSTAPSSQKEINPDMQINPLSSRDSLADIIIRKNELEKICEGQAAKINELTSLAPRFLLLVGNSQNHCGEAQEAMIEKDPDTVSSSANDSLLHLLRNGPPNPNPSQADRGEDLEEERERWTESESRWICLTEELRIDLESHRRLAESKDRELAMEKKCSAELDDALQRAIVSQVKMVEHFAELQEKHNEVVERHKRVMEGVAQVKKAAAKAGAKGAGSAFAEALAAELSTLRVEREREIALLKKQNRGLRVQLKDTAEAVHAAGELLVRLREAEEAVTAAEGKSEEAQREMEKLKKQMRKMKEKHAMEMATVKHCLADSRLPESALEPLFRAERREDAAEGSTSAGGDEEESWRAAFVSSYR